MKTAIKYLIVSTLLITVVYGCKKGGTTPEPIIPDTTVPTISVTKPTAGQVFVPGNTITFQASFTDNDKLGSYDIAITKKITSAFILKNVPTPVPWSYTKGSVSFPTGPKTTDITYDIHIPLDINGSPLATGDYNFVVTCTDAAGNITITPSNLYIKIN